MFAREYRFLCAAALGLGALASSGAARGDDIVAQLDYLAAPGCPLATDFEALVVRGLGRDPFRSDATEKVVVRIEFSGPELVGRFEWKDASGQWLGDRVFSSRSRDCRELVRVMGFTLALQFQLMAAESPPGSRPAQPPQTGPATADGPSTPSIAVARLRRPDVTPAVSSASAPSGPSLALGGGASVGIGLAPSAIALGRLFGTLAWSRVALEIGAELSAPSTMRESGGGGFSERVMFASAAGCAGGSVVSACLLARYGEIRVAGEGVDVPLVSSGALIQTGLRVALTHSFAHRIHITARAESVAQLTRGVVTLDALPIWTAPRVAGDLGIDIAVGFP